MPRETPLAVTRGDDESAEAEMAIVEVDDKVATIVLDDDGPIYFDLVELRAALGVQQPAAPVGAARARRIARIRGLLRVRRG